MKEHIFENIRLSSMSPYFSFTILILLLVITQVQSSVQLTTNMLSNMTSPETTEEADTKTKPEVTGPEVTWSATTDGTSGYDGDVTSDQVSSRKPRPYTVGYHGGSSKHSSPSARDERNVPTTTDPRGPLSEGTGTQGQSNPTRAPRETSSGAPKDVDSVNKRSNNLEEQLLHELFYFGYGADARAVLDSTATVTVKIQYTLLRIQKLDERTQVLTTTGLVITEWQDDRLKWNPDRFGNLTDLVVPPHYVWLPELTLINGADEIAHDFNRMKALVSYDGQVHWEPGGIFATTCDMDITYFPFDSQKCPVIIGAWAYYSTRMNLTAASNTVQLHDFSPNGEWQIIETSMDWDVAQTREYSSMSIPFVVCTLYMKRRIQYYIVNVIIPCLILSVLVLVIFCIPAEAGEKISCGISVLLAFTVFLLMVSESIPRTSLQVPVMVVYLMVTMMLNAVSVCLSIWVLHVHHTDTAKSVPTWVKIIIVHYLARGLCVSLNSHKFVKPNKSFRGERSKHRVRTNWSNRIQSCEANNVAATRPPCRRRRTVQDRGTQVRQGDQSTSTSALSDTYTAEPQVTDNAQCNLHYEMEASEMFRRAQASESDGDNHIPSKEMPNTTIGPSTCRQEERLANKSSSSFSSIAEFPLKWTDIARVMDRLFFIVVFLAMIVCCTFTLCLPYFVSFGKNVLQ